MKFLTKRMIVAINRLSAEHAGGLSMGSNNLRSGQTLGFVETVRHNRIFGQRLYADIYHQAAALMFYIIKNHTFIDGNKRTGLAVAVTLLYWNNVQTRSFDSEVEVYEFVMSVAHYTNASSEPIRMIAAWLKPN